MEMPEQEVPVVFSQMLQMFPNIPHDIIWMYVQRYSSDVEKCAQMLNLQNGKYTGMQLSSLDNTKNLSNCNIVLQAPHLVLNSETILDNNNDVPLTKQLASLSNDGGDIIESSVNDNQQNEETSYDSHSSYSMSQVSSNSVYENNFATDTSKNLSTAINFNEPLILDIVPDDDGISHSWRPSISADVLCSDLFVPSPMFDNFQLHSNLISNLNFERNHSEFHINSSTVEEDSWRYPSSPVQMLHGYPLQDGRNYGKDIASYLHYQKSQMNVIRYEVIKAKIELSDLKDYVEKLDCELKEKMQSKSVQDIVDLNKEIEQLRLDCQCLCSEIDYNVEDPVLLGEVDERCYEKNKSSFKNTETQGTASDPCTNSHEAASSDIQDESNRWQCPKCTFANHPAIFVCEMCQLPKPIPRRPPLLPATSSSCHCHPKEKSLSVQS